MAALVAWEWLQNNGTRPPLRSALIRFWVNSRLFRAPVPLTGPLSLSAEAPNDKGAWLDAFLEALASEALDYHQLLLYVEREWFSAKRRVVGRRRNSRASVAIDVLAAAPQLSATTLAKAIGMCRLSPDGGLTGGRRATRQSRATREISPQRHRSGR